MKEKFGRKITKRFAGLRPKMRTYLKDDGSGNKKARRTKRCKIKRRIKVEGYRSCSVNNEIIWRRFRSQAHNIVTEKVNIIALRVNDDNKLQNIWCC